jgi:2-hydroxychromene-2-carboxylate isomerase
MLNRTEQTEFFFDVGSPYAYLAAERIERVLGRAVVWRPVLLGGLFRLTGRGSWALGDPARRAAGMAVVEARAARYGLPPVRWPEPWPGDGLYAMRVATLAAREGIGRAFALAALRAAFADGRDLSDRDAVGAVAASAGVDVSGAEEPAVKAALRDATESAHARGVFGVPTVAVGDELFWGDDRLEEAAATPRA